MKVIGVDPGSSSWDIYGINTDTNEVFLDISIESDTILNEPDKFFEILSNEKKIDLLAAPSGFGLPIKQVNQLTEQDFFEITLKKNKSKSIMGLQTILEKLKGTEINSIILPGIKHLPTIPQYRKINVIDMGTADKLCIAVVGIKDMVENLNITPNQVNTIIIEFGSAFTSLIAIEEGQIIDAIGGTNIMGINNIGSIDGEIAYLLGSFTKKDIYSGGLKSIMGEIYKPTNEILQQASNNHLHKNAILKLIEGIIKGVYSLKSSFRTETPPNYILLSGKNSNIPYFEKILNERLKDIAPIRIMKTYASQSKRAAQGAAFIAEGINGGPSKDIIDNLRILDANGHVWDDVFLPLNLKQYF